MKKLALLLLLALSCSLAANAQFGSKIKKADQKYGGAAKKATQALTISDEELAAYVQEYVDWMDAHNPVCSVNDKDAGMRSFAERLERIIASAPDVKKLGLDIKVYYVVNVNAFSCANGSIRVFAGLMELMTDEEILAIVGHEVGHYVAKDTKAAFKTALLTSALKDVVATTGKTANKLSNSQLGELGEAVTSAQFSQKQEYAADDYGYEFLKRAGKDARSMASALRVLVRLEEDANIDKSMSKALFSSHPDSAKRAVKLDEKYAAESK